MRRGERSAHATKRGGREVGIREREGEKLETVWFDLRSVEGRSRTRENKKQTLFEAVTEIPAAVPATPARRAFAASFEAVPQQGETEHPQSDQATS